jgi:hypothetical protein
LQRGIESVQSVLAELDIVEVGRVRIDGNPGRSFDEARGLGLMTSTILIERFNSENQTT